MARAPSGNRTPDVDLKRRVAVVTGGSSGIGLAIARAFVDRGMRVAIAARNGRRLKAAADDLGPGVLAVPADVSKGDDVEALFARVVDTFGTVDVLVNNAGVGSGGTVAEMDPATWRKVMAINVDGAFLCARAAWPWLKGGDGGQVINISSVAGKEGFGGASAYSASKFALVGFSESLREEGVEDRVKVSVICPGYVDTPMLQSFFGSSGDIESLKSEVRRVHPIGRYGTPDDVANLVNWLAGDEARYASGQLWVLDGGLTAQVQQMNV